MLNTILRNKLVILWPVTAIHGVGIDTWLHKSRLRSGHTFSTSLKPQHWLMLRKWSVEWSDLCVEVFSNQRFICHWRLYKIGTVYRVYVLSLIPFKTYWVPYFFVYLPKRDSHVCLIKTIKFNQIRSIHN